MTAVLLRAVAVVSAVLAIVGVGLAPGAGPKPEPTVVSVRLSETGITLSQTSVPAGRVLFSVQNRSSHRRGFEVVGAARTRLLGPGRKTSVVVRFAKGGRRVLRSAGAPGKSSPTLTRSLRVTPAATTPSPGPKLVLTLIQSGLGSPTHVVAPPGDGSRLLVVQQNGLVSLIENGALRADPFLDLRGVVRAEGEKGLLSIAFAPDYAVSGLLYAYFNNRDGNIRVVEYRRSVSDHDLVDRSTRRVLLSLVKPTADHNGGMMQFGPDGYLYIAIGDGGANPPTIPVGVTGQTLDDLFGSILRIDPRHGSPYAIPPGNPFVSVAGARPEIVAYGLRNPWRFWIDAKKNQMLIGDVGEGTREEIDRLPLRQLGLDFGWPCKEGNATPPEVSLPTACKSTTLTPPLWGYPHSATRCSITGGVVSHDPRLPGLDGLYLWSDYCDGQVYALDPGAARPVEIPLRIRASQPTSFGADAAGHAYLTTAGGSLFRIDPSR